MDEGSELQKFNNGAEFSPIIVVSALLLCMISALGVAVCLYSGAIAFRCSIAGKAKALMRCLRQCAAMKRAYFKECSALCTSIAKGSERCHTKIADNIVGVGYMAAWRWPWEGSLRPRL